VHLGQSEVFADLGLGEVVFEAQAQDDALAVVESGEQAVDGGGGFDTIEPVVFDADSSEDSRVAFTTA